MAASSLTLNSALSLAQNTGAVIQFDEISQTPFYEYIQSTIEIPIQHIVWFIDARSISALSDLIIEQGLNGTRVWNIMSYTPQLWLIFNSQYDIIKILPFQ